MDSSPESSPQRYQDDSNNLQEQSGMEGEVYYVDEYGNPVQLQEGQEYEYAEGQEHEGRYEGEYQEGDESGEYEHGHDEHDEDGIDDDDDALEEHEEGDIIMEQHSRKIKRDIQENLNKYRKGKELQRLYNDLFSSLIAGDYAEYLKHNEHDPDLFKQLCEEYQIFGDLKVVYTISRFEEDANISETFHQDFLDLGYLLLEVETDRQVILDNHFNHIGIGVSMTAEKMILVETFSQKLLTISKISEGEDGGIEVRGKMLTSERGLYAVRLQSVEAKRELLIGPENMEFDRNTKEFIVFLDTEETVGSSHKIIEFYVRVKPDSIEYRKATKEKINLKHLELAHRIPCTTYPDPRYLQEDEEDKIRKEQETLERMRLEEEKRMKKDEERRERKDLRRALRQEIEDRRARGEEIESLASSTQRSDRSFMSKQSFAGRALQAMQSDGMGESKSIASPDRSVGEGDRSEIESIRKGEDQEDKVVEDDDESKEYADEDESVSKSPMVTNKDIKDELELAIEEAQRQLKKEEDRNFFLQQLILQLRDKNDLNLEKQNEIPMTEPKYLNTLAHVHQIRLDLKQTQDRYNDMARELQYKLDEKQAKCFEIRKAFMDLKKEVCKKAAFSRTDKAIPDMLIEEWKEREDDKSKELQLLRLENLRLRNHLAKNQKVLKKKEELAEGLHLIDYEQLKIENQTLNEKIEERNEDLHKLKKKNTNTVQILTHFKEKLQFVIQENEKLKVEGEDKEGVLIKLRKDLNDLKDSKKDLKTQNQHLRQQTGIMNSKYLSKDFENLKTTLRDQRIDLRFHQEKHKYMLSLVEELNRRTGKKTR
jgi:hypothetical protein